MTLLNEIKRREAHYLKRASESDQRAGGAIDAGEYRAWKEIAATWRSLAAQARESTELLGLINRPCPAETEALESVA